MPGLYVHFPFCASKCTYCDFYARVRRDWTPYADALLRELAERKLFLKGVPPSTLYYGGGTPSLLPVTVLSRVTAAIHRFFGTTGHLLREFTLEANPDDITPDRAAAWRSLGVNRVSMGVQSFCDEHLRWMKRRHTSNGTVAAFEMLRRAGFDNLSIDLIFGFTGLSDDEWVRSIDQATALRPEHISCYQMMGRYADPDQERCRGQYRILQQRLSSAGYRQYEVSNFALPGRASVHNSAYWSREAYLGLGAGAHSFDGDRLRCWNMPDIDAYVASRPSDSEQLSEREVFEEKLMLGLRTVQGVSLSALTPEERAMLAQKEPVLEQLSKTGKLIVSTDSVRIPPEELFVSDAVIRSLFPD